jgi:hypothetical protein
MSVRDDRVLPRGAVYENGIPHPEPLTRDLKSARTLYESTTVSLISFQNLHCGTIGRNEGRLDVPSISLLFATMKQFD